MTLTFVDTGWERIAATFFASNPDKCQMCFAQDVAARAMLCSGNRTSQKAVYLQCLASHDVRGVPDSKANRFKSNGHGIGFELRTKLQDQQTNRKTHPQLHVAVASRAMLKPAKRIPNKP